MASHAATSPIATSRPPDANLEGLDTIKREAIERLPLGVLVVDGQLRAIYRNPAADTLLPPASTVAESLQAVTLDPRFPDWSAGLGEVLREGTEQRFDQIVCRLHDDREALINLLVMPLAESGADTAGGILVIEDVTAQAGLEKRLAVSERMAAVGKLAARVAHDLNNPLDGILRYLNLALRSIETDRIERLEDYLLQARGGLIRMTEIIRELVEFSRSSYTAFDDSSINAAVEEAINVLADKADAAGVSIVCRLQQGMPAMRSTSLFQVFCNLTKNAIDAMPQGGTLTVITEVLESHAVIRFEDTGVGLPDDMQRVFEPFFTTKAPGKGTGLGLAICKDIVEKFNGRITAARRPDGGSVFTVIIPLESCARLRPPGGEPAGAIFTPDRSEPQP